MAAAIEHYRGLGAADIEELGKPYDLRVILGKREIHVEVKGSLGPLSFVTVTKNEVSHARDTSGTQLFVLDSIELRTEQDGGLLTNGGRKRIWRDWSPSDDSLTPLTYSHLLS